MNHRGPYRPAPEAEYPPAQRVPGVGSRRRDPGRRPDLRRGPLRAGAAVGLPGRYAARPVIGRDRSGVRTRWWTPCRMPPPTRARRSGKLRSPIPSTGSASRSRTWPTARCAARGHHRIRRGQHRKNPHRGGVLPPGGNRRAGTGHPAGLLQRRVPAEGHGQHQQRRLLAPAHAGHRLPRTDRVCRHPWHHLRPGREPC